MIWNLVLLCGLFLLLYLICRRIKKKTYTDNSSIHGKGIFASSDIQKGGLLIYDLFENKPKDVTLYHGISDTKFYHYLSDDASKLNHCSKNDNSKIITTDHKLYTLFANRDIKQGDEITVNYDTTHDMYPFIGGSKKRFTDC